MPAKCEVTCVNQGEAGRRGERKKEKRKPELSDPFTIAELRCTKIYDVLYKHVIECVILLALRLYFIFHSQMGRVLMIFQ